MSLLVARAARRDLDARGAETGAGTRLAIASFTAARHLARALSEPTTGARVISAAELAALAVLDRVVRAFLRHHVGRRAVALWRRALGRLEEDLGGDTVHRELARFAVEFGLVPEDDDEMRDGQAVAGEDILVEVVLYWLHVSNPAAAPLVSTLYRGFEPGTTFGRMLAGLERFLGECGGELEATLLDDLLAPMRSSPESLTGQLDFVRERWAEVLGDELAAIQGVLDLAAEEEAPRWGPGGAPPIEVGVASEGERRYSEDLDWMPSLVLAAKNTLVWLDQMSQAYGREIRRLDEVPDGELELLAARGLTGLWLIGLWERSPASAEIKRRRGNPEAASSAYSLRAYRIAAELGGEEALADLRRRAARFGIRLAADMVPNHMGIDSDWVLDHPERFVQVEQPPYPAYSFTGPDLSPRPGVTLQIEDHYYDGSDAAVVFRRHEHASGDVRFLYHGNDGTSTPWNDTAQLDYLSEATRAAVMATILDVARRFSVIRFDAAMTLAKRHYQRLWHPLPGDAGAIPSRAEHGLTRAEFDRLMPREFWREVVDLVAREAPDTLLLAEAFWLMEGYFVRTLGMHRVYNSAFMHMLRDRETDKFKRLLAETLAFDPEILKRYVNFMSNPDEEPAAVQFGDGDRYFGVCTVLATLPGLPMFAHGQWDGLHEKYGMEYRRAYHGELPHRSVIDRHDRVIAPLLKERARFAGVEDFRLYDFHDRNGIVNQDVLAYSNGRAGATAVVVFNNSQHRVVGRLDGSMRFRREGAAGESSGERLADLLGEPAGALWRYRDRARGREYLADARRCRAEGLTLALDGFQAVVLDGFENRADDSLGTWSRLADKLDGQGTESLDRELLALSIEPLRAAVVALADSLAVRVATEGEAQPDSIAPAVALAAAERELGEVLARPPIELAGPASPADSSAFERGLVGLVESPALATGPEEVRAAIAECRQTLGESLDVRFAAGLAPLAARVVVAVGEPTGAKLIDALLAEAPLGDAGRRRVGRWVAAAVRLAWLRPQVPPGAGELAPMVEAWQSDDDLRAALSCHEAGGVDWFVREDLEGVIAWRTLLAVCSWLGADVGEEDEIAGAILGWTLAGREIGRAAERAGYRLISWAAACGRRDAGAAPRSTAQGDEPSGGGA